MKIDCSCGNAFQFDYYHCEEDGVKGKVTVACPYCSDVFSVSVSILSVNLRKREYRDAETLQELYIEQRRPMSEIAMMYGVSATTINNWLLRHDIPTRPRGRRYIGFIRRR